MSIGFEPGKRLRRQIAHALQGVPHVLRARRVALVVRESDARLMIRSDVLGELRRSGRRAEAAELAKKLAGCGEVVAIVLRAGDVPRVLELAAVRMGELARELPKASPPGKKSPTRGLNSKSAALESVGISKQRAAEYERAARLPAKDSPAQRKLTAGERAAVAVLANRPLAPPGASKGRI